MSDDAYTTNANPQKCTSYMDWEERTIKEFREAQAVIRNRHQFAAFTITTRPKDL